MVKRVKEKVRELFDMQASYDQRTTKKLSTIDNEKLLKILECMAKKSQADNDPFFGKLDDQNDEFLDLGLGEPDNTAYKRVQIMNEEFLNV